MFSKIKNFCFLFVLMAVFFASCANDSASDSQARGDSKQIILSSNVSTIDETSNSIEFEVSFSNFSTTPSTVDVYLENNSYTFLTDIPVINDRITVDFANVAEGTHTIYVKVEDISSNTVSITINRHKYISIRLGKACDSKEEISSYLSDDYLFDDEIEDKNAAVARGYYYGLQLMAENFSGYDISLTIEGNNSSDTVISDFVNAPGYGVFYPIFVASDETAESITIIASYDYDQTIKGTLTLELCNKFNRDSFSSELSFTEKTFLTEKDISYICETISGNKCIDYNLDFTNCRFEFDRVPSIAFCKISPWKSYSWDYIIEEYGTPDIRLEEDGALMNIKSIILPDSIKEIGRYAFAYCFNMKLEQLPQSLESIGDSAFLYCKSITINKIPDSVKTLDSYSFERCYGITSIELSKDLNYFYVSSFDECVNLHEIEIPAKVRNVRNGTGTTYFEFVVNSENQFFKAENGILYSKDGKTLYRIPNSKVGYSYSIPSSVSKVAAEAIGGLKDLIVLNIPSSVTEMQRDAIENCMNLEIINIDFAEKPEGWDERWLWYDTGKTINFIGAPTDNGNEDSDSENSLNGAYTIKDNTSAQLKFSNGNLEFIYTGLTRSTYSYEISDSTLTVTMNVSQGTFVGEFDIETTDNGYILTRKDDTALSWVGQWTAGKSLEKLEIYK